MIVEFGDFGCSACAAFANAMMPAIIRDWVDTGRARVQFVPFDLLRTGRLALDRPVADLDSALVYSAGVAANA